MGRAASSVEEATGLANASGDALAEIVSLASSNSPVVASIATAAEEQSATSEEINMAIEEINRIVAETSEGMVQSAAAVQDLSRMASGTAPGHGRSGIKPGVPHPDPYTPTNGASLKRPRSLVRRTWRVFI